MLIVKKVIDNSDFINAISDLKHRGIINVNKDVADAMKCSEGIISAYVNNKKKVGELFWIKFTKEFNLVKREPINQFTDPQEKYNAVNAPRPDYLILAVLEKSLSEQVAQTQIQLQNAQMIKLLAEQFLSGNNKKQLEGVDLKFTTSSRKHQKTH